MIPDDFDQRIRDALGAADAPPPAQLARLEQFWRDQSRVRHRRRRRIRVVALAASLALVSLGWSAFNATRRARTPNPGQIAETSQPRDVRETSPPRTVDQPAAPALPASARVPTAYERLVFAARTSAPADPEQTLLGQLRTAATLAERRELIDQLRDIGTQRSIPGLLAQAETPALRAEAIDAVQFLLGDAGLPRAARQARSPAVRVAILSRVLFDESDQSLDNFLALVADPGLRNDSLATASAAANADELPLDALMEQLDAPERSTRLAAAIVLGHVGGPAVGAALVDRASQPQRPSIETWIALLACRGEPVDRFLAHASRQPQMLGQFNYARSYWSRIMP